MKIILMILTLLFITNISFAEENGSTASAINKFNDISWSRVSRVEKVKKIIARITILRMMGVVPASFWSEFGLDLDKDTLDWEKIDGIDIDMVLSAHESMTQQIEAKLNENGSTLGGEEFLRATIMAATLKILDYHIKNGKILDENFEPILDKNLQKKIKDRIKILAGDKINPEDGINGEGLPSNSDSTHQFTDKFKNRLSDLFSGFDSDDPVGSLADQLGAFGNEFDINSKIGKDKVIGMIILGVVAIVVVVKGCDTVDRAIDTADRINDTINKAIDKWDGHIIYNEILSNNGNNSANNNASNNGNNNGNNNASNNGNNNGNGNASNNGNNNGNGNASNNVSNNTDNTDNTGCGKDQSCDNSDGEEDSTTNDNENSKDKMGENDPDAPWNENDSSTGSGEPSSKDLDNINNNSNTHGGTTYIENATRITATELETAMKRIEVIKNEYGSPCNELTGKGCNGATGEYKDDPLKTGEAVTNPGKLEK